MYLHKADNLEKKKKFKTWMKVEVRVVRVLYVLIAREAVFYDVIDGRVVFGDEVVDSHR